LKAESVLVKAVRELLGCKKGPVQAAKVIVAAGRVPKKPLECL
jgi:hypothetical protein